MPRNTSPPDAISFNISDYSRQPIPTTQTSVPNSPTASDTGPQIVLPSSEQTPGTGRILRSQSHLLVGMGSNQARHQRPQPAQELQEAGMGHDGLLAELDSIDAGGRSPTPQTSSRIEARRAVVRNTDIALANVKGSSGSLLGVPQPATAIPSPRSRPSSSLSAQPPGSPMIDGEHTEDEAGEQAEKDKRQQREDARSQSRDSDSEPQPAERQDSDSKEQPPTKKRKTLPRRAKSRPEAASSSTAAPSSPPAPRTTAGQRRRLALETKTK